MQLYNWDVDLRKKRALDDSVIVFLGSQFSGKKNQTKTRTKNKTLVNAYLGRVFLNLDVLRRVKP